MQRKPEGRRLAAHLLLRGAGFRLAAAAFGLAGALPDGPSAPVEMVLGLVRTDARTFIPLLSTRTLVLRHLLFSPPFGYGRVLFYTKSKPFQVLTPMPSRSTVLLAAIPSLGILLALLLAYFLR